MELPIFQVDAFTDRVLAGNPAAVVPLREWLPAERMQAIAAENNLSETAFLVGGGGAYGIRWFTPAVEVELCGHATIASAFLVATVLDPGRDRVVFRCAAHGDLPVEREGDVYHLDFPSLETFAFSDFGRLLVYPISGDDLGQCPELVNNAVEGTFGSPSFDSNWQPICDFREGLIRYEDVPEGPHAWVVLTQDSSNRTLLSGSGQGSGISLPFAEDITLSPDKQTIAVISSGQVVAVDVATGDRSLPVHKTVGSGPGPAAPRAGAFDPSAPLLYGDLLFLSLSDRGLMIVDRDSGRLFQSFDPGPGVSSQPAVVGDRLYVLSNGGVLYAMSLAPR